MFRLKSVFSGLAALLIFAGIGLVGCSGPAPTDARAADGLPVDSYPDATSIRNQLLLGTIRLEGTPNAVTVEQAKKLLPLWEAHQGLTTSGSAAQAELDAVLAQIEKALTPEQVAAIAALKLTTTDLNAYYDSVGLTQSTPAPGVTPGAGQSMTQAEKDARRAANGGSATGSTRGTVLLDNVLKLLGERAAK